MSTKTKVDLSSSWTNENSNGHRKENENFQYSKDFILFVSGIRLICTLIWVGAISYATYHVYLAAEEYLPWQADPVMNPGPFTNLLRRGRDITDYEWFHFTNMFFFNLLSWYIAYLLFSTLVNSRLLPAVSTVMSFFFLAYLINTISTVYIFVQPLIYWLFLNKVRNRFIIWGITFGFLYSLNSTWLQEMLLGAHSDYYFAIACAWTYARCISFTFDRWNRTDNNSVKALFSVLNYCFYFPVVIHGPIVLYNRYEADMIFNGREKNPSRLNWRLLLKSTAKLSGVFIANELVLHYLYFRPLSLTFPLLKHNINLWAVCGIIYWLGQFFMLKYYIFYGCSTCVAQFDGVHMPPLPKCIAHIHRYSVMWKDFDRGLYNFLVQYTYLPIVTSLQNMDKLKGWPPEFVKLLASFFSFTYVFFWHGVWYTVFVWSALNFLGISVEGVGSFIKRFIETKEVKENEVYSPLFWDFVVEPIVTIPLAAMSILNSVVFCGSYEAAVIFSERLLWTDAKDSYAFLFLYFFAQFAVTVRTWSMFFPVMKHHML